MARPSRPSLRREVAPSGDAERALAELEGEAQPHGKTAAASAVDGLKKDTHSPTTLNLSRDMVEMLRIIATARARQEGGRPSVSAIVEELLERHRGELVAELPPRYRVLFDDES